MSSSLSALKQEYNKIYCFLSKCCSMG